jgi:hypothetical protein
MINILVIKFDYLMETQMHYLHDMSRSVWMMFVKEIKVAIFVCVRRGGGLFPLHEFICTSYVH